MVEVFFALNRPNYARWGYLFLSKLQNMDPRAREVLDAGAMSIRRTGKSYARSAVDLTLEQTVKRDAASPTKGITAFTNSQSAFRRWSITLTQRTMALSELCEMVSFQTGEEPANQVKKSRIERDNTNMVFLTNTVKNTCNPFADDSSAELVNISSGRSANTSTKAFLLGTIARGRNLRQQFQNECEADESRFLKPVSRSKMLNFAAENSKESKNATRRLDAAEGVRDAFGRILAVAAESSDVFDLRHVLSFPITEVPPSLAHCDGKGNSDKDTRK